MSGFEIAGIVLGGFPIVLKCLEEYRRVFEPIDDWWHFNHRFNGLVNDIRHQLLLFHVNMSRLLNPIVPSNDDFLQLANNPEDPRWLDGSLDRALQLRLGSEVDRVMDYIQRIYRSIEEVKSLLLIADGQVSQFLGAVCRCNG
jgi:hypothetical protein